MAAQRQAEKQSGLSRQKSVLVLRSVMAKGVFTLSKVNRFASAHAWISNRFCQREREAERDFTGSAGFAAYTLLTLISLWEE